MILLVEKGLVVVAVKVLIENAAESVVDKIWVF